MPEKRLSIVPPDVTPDDLEDFLATDDLFIDYFNAFLQLPTFSEPVFFNKERGGFEVVSDAKQSLKSKLRTLIRSQQKPNPIYKAAVAVATAKKPPKMPWHYLEDAEEEPEFKTSFKVQCLNKEQGIRWVKAERLPAFLQSDCYIEYRLAKLVAQAEVADKGTDTPLNLFIDPKYDPFAIERPPVIEPPKIDEQAVAIRDMFVCMGDASTTQTKEWFSNVKFSATTTTTSSGKKRPSSAIGPSRSQLASPRPGSVMSVLTPTVDSGFASPARFDMLNSSLTSQDLTMDSVADLPNRERLFDNPPQPREWRAPIGDKVCVVADTEKRGGRGYGGAFHLDITRQPETVLEDDESVNSSEDHTDKASLVSGESGCDIESQQLDDTDSIDLTEVEGKAETKTEQEGDRDEAVASTPAPKVIKVRNISDIASVVVSVSLKKAIGVVSETPQEEIDRFLDENVLQMGGVKMADLTESWEEQLEYEPQPLRSILTTPRNITLQVPDELDRSMSRMSTTISESKDTGGEAESLFDSDQEDEEEVNEESRDSIFAKPKQTFDFTSKKGLDAFRKFLWGSEGEKCWNFWLDIDRGTMIEDEDVKKAFLSQLRDKYLKVGGDCELSTEMRERLGLRTPSQWSSIQKLAQLKKDVVQPLLLYWAPRFLMRETYQQSQPDNYLYTRQQLLTRPAPTPYPEPKTVTLLPLRPKTCWPRLRSHSVETESPTKVHVNQHMKVPPPPPTDLRQGKPQSTTITPLGQARRGDAKPSGGSSNNQHQRSQTLPIIPLTNAMTAITPKQAVPLGRASAPQVAPQNKVETVNYGSPAGPESISRIKPVPPKSAPPVMGAARRRKVDDAVSIKSVEEQTNKKTDDEEDDDEEEEEENDEEENASEAGKEETSIKAEKSSSPDAKKEPRPSSAASVASSLDSEFLGGLRMDGLLQDLYLEKKSGGFIRHFLEKREDEIALNCLGCWHELQEYHALFYSDIFNPYNLARKAQTIHSKYIIERCYFNIECPPVVRYHVFCQMDPPFEELFDSVEQHLLEMLLIPWLDMKDTDRSLYSKIELFEEERHLDSMKSKHLQRLQRRLMRERMATPDFTMEGEDEETKREVYYETLAEKVPPEFRDYDFDKLIRNRMEVEQFRKFLEENYAMMDLMCWLDIESFRRTPHLDTTKRDTKATDIKTKYLNKKYFFGPNSPATRMQQHEVMMAGGGWGKLLLDRPPNQIMLEAQKYVRERLARKWLPLFIMTEAFQERQRPNIKMEDVVDDVMASKRKRYMAIYKLLESRFVSSSHDIMALRQALLNPLTCQHFRKYVGLKGDQLENDILFWLEVQKFKEMYHTHTEEALIHQKIQAILRCFINSEMGPSLQIDITPEQAEKILDKRMREMGPYVFRDAQLTVFRVLSSHWKDFQKYRTSLSEEKMLEELDRKRKKQRKKDMERARLEDEREYAKQNAAKDEEHPSLMTTTGSTASLRRMSTRLSGIIPGFLDDDEEEEEEKVQWKYSDYMDGLDQEKQLLNGDDRASSLMSTIESLAEDQDSARTEKTTKNSVNESEKHAKGKKSRLKPTEHKYRPGSSSSIKEHKLPSNGVPPKASTKKRVTLVEPPKNLLYMAPKAPRVSVGPKGDMGSRVKGQQGSHGQARQPVPPKKKK